MIALVALVALAHEPQGCPPVRALRAAVERGPLSPAERACAQASDDPEAPGLLVLDDLGAAEPPADLGPRVEAWLARTDRPADALRVAERARDPALGILALETAVALSPRWIQPAERADGLVALAAARARLHPPAAVAWAQEAAFLGVVGAPLEEARAACAAIADEATCARPVAPRAPPPLPPTPDDLVPCRDLGRLWERALGDTVYASERDCVVRLLDGLDGEALRVAARLVVLLAARHRDKTQGLVAIHRVLAVLPDDPVARSTAATWHADLGDPIGAATWARPPDPR